MKILNVEQNTQEWHDARKGKITGSKLADIVVQKGTEKKLGFYQLIADKLAIEDEEIDGTERGHRLEEEAIQSLENALGRTFTRGMMWVSDENENIAISPDGAYGDGVTYTEAAEAKCLSTSRYLKAYFEHRIPKEYEFQKLQYFIVNEALETLYFCFYDPRVTAMPFFYITINREDIEEAIALYKQYQLDILREVDELTAQLAF